MSYEQEQMQRYVAAMPLVMSVLKEALEEEMRRNPDAADIPCNYTETTLVRRLMYAIASVDCDSQSEIYHRWDRECVKCGKQWLETPAQPVCPNCESTTTEAGAAT